MEKKATMQIKTIRLLVTALLLTGIAQAQTGARVKGKVLDENGAGLAGATVNVTNNANNKTVNTVTDNKGNFTLEDLDKTFLYHFYFTATGYKPDTVKNFKVSAGDNNSLLIRMHAAVNALNEVVVVGYGTQSRSRVTGAITSLKSEELNKYASGSFGQQLAGRAAGIQINDASALPGTDPQIVIRGISTLTAGTFPLIVVDGFPLSEGSSLNAINAQDIETIDILKDPSSAAIYGSRAANGVILITTKSGKGDKTKLSFDAYTGFQERSDKVKLMDGYQYAQYSTEARNWGYMSKDQAHRTLNDDVATRKANGATARDYVLNYVGPWLGKQSGLTNTNWLDAIFKTAPVNNYNLSLSGNNSKTSYYISGNYFNQQGIILNTGLERFSGVVKVNSQPTDWLKVGISVNPSYNIQKFYKNDASRNSDPLAATLIMYPFFPVYNADGSLAISQQIKANTPEDGALGENPVAIMKMTTYNRNFFRNFGNAFLEFKLAKGLRFKTMLGGDYTGTNINYYTPSNVGAYRTAAPKPAAASATNAAVWNYITENTLTYSKTFGKHDINLLAGYSFQKENGDSTVVNGTNIPDDNLQNISGATSFSATKSAYTWSQLSYLSRLQYAFADRYLFTAAIRRDGSSRFGQNSKYGYFPSLTAGWIISKEYFMQGLSWLNLLKLRATWGKAGNNQIGAYGSQALVTQENYVYGNTLAPGYAATTAPNANLSWETKTAFNVGFDASIYKRFSVTLNYYHTTTSNLLLNVPVPAQSGYVTSLQNIGKVKNSGLELEFSGNDIQLGPVKWSYSANVTSNKNQVLALAQGQQQIYTGKNSAFLTKVGGSIAEMYGYDVTGVYKSQADIDNTPHIAGTVVGDYIMRDLTNDGKITTADRRGFGSYSPKLVYGFSSDFSYKNFDFSFSITGLTGRKIYDNSLWLMESGESFGVGNQYYFQNRWDPNDNPNGFLARPTTNLSANRLNAQASNQFFYDAHYLRVRMIQLGYNLPARLLLKNRITECRVYVSANNPFLFTPYRGFNPDATSSNVLTSGAADSNYPVARSFQVGMHLVL
ncbi:SusC/RagA family TonB-linked outer membrane protein [Filimonas lacunae]|nr:TonB-dependent receptor [Filimonas lacunae]